MGVFLFDAGVRPYAPAFVDGTTGGTGGTVSDGGQPGRVTFTLPSSGHSDPSDGCWISWPAVDVLGRRLPDVPTGLPSGLDLLAAGSVRWRAHALPTLGNGVVVWGGVILTPSAATVMGSDSQAFPGLQNFKAAIEVAGARWRSGSWGEASDFGLGTDRSRVHVECLWDIGGTAASLLDGPREVAVTRSGFSSAPLAFLDGHERRIIIGAYRTGSSSGSESVELRDIEAHLYMMEAL